MILALPTEILVNILRRLGARDILRCSSVNRLIHGIIKHSALLKYVIELDVAGQVDGNMDSIPSSARLSLLQAYQNRWNELAWDSQHFAFNIKDDHNYTLCDGVLAHSYPLEHPHSDPTTALVVHFLPSSNPPSPGNGVTDPLDLEILVEEFLIEPGQDLLVLLEYSPGKFQFHLRTISSNLPHPKAAKPCLTYLWVGDSGAVEILDDKLGILFENPEGVSQVVTWNWQTGIIEAAQHLVSSHDFSFLSRDTLVILSHSHNIISLDVYVISATAGIPSHVASLFLPELKQEFSISNITLSGNRPSSSLPAHPTPFMTAPDSAILALVIDFESQDTGEETYTLLLHRSSLMRYRKEVLLRGNITKVSWEDWGPQSTRFLNIGSNDWGGSAQGSRYVALVEKMPANDQGFLLGCLRVHDFNPLSLRRYSHGQHPPISGRIVKVITEPTTLDDPFKDQVKTYLPYLEVTTTEGYNFDTLIVDHGHIIGMECATEQNIELHVLVM